MSDKVEGVLEIGTNETHEVVINHPDLKPDANGVGHIVFSTNQARNLAGLLFQKAAEADMEKFNALGGLLRTAKPKDCFCAPGKCSAPVIMGRQMSCLNPEKAKGIRCCEGGYFGENHQCRKSPEPTPVHMPSEAKCVHCHLPLERCQSTKWEREVINRTVINWRFDEESRSYVVEFPRKLTSAATKEHAFESIKRVVAMTAHLFETGEFPGTTQHPEDVCDMEPQPPTTERGQENQSETLTRTAETIIAICGAYIPGGWEHPGDGCASKIAELLHNSLPLPQSNFWLKPSAHLPEDDSEVFVAVLWRNQEKNIEEYGIAHCTYYEESGADEGQQLFTDCEGELYTPKEVSYWIYARALLDLLPAIETIGNTPATVTTERSDGRVRDPEDREPRQQGTSK